MGTLRYIINTIDGNGKTENDKGYNSFTLNKAMQAYMKTPWFKANWEIIKNEKKPWRTHPDIVTAILNGSPDGKTPGFRQINQQYITSGEDRFLIENKRLLEKHSKLKMESRLKHIELLQKANQFIEN